MEETEAQPSTSTPPMEADIPLSPPTSAEATSSSDDTVSLSSAKEEDPSPPPPKKKRTLSAKQLESLAKGRERLQQKNLTKREQRVEQIVDNYLEEKKIASISTQEPPSPKKTKAYAKSSKRSQRKLTRPTSPVTTPETSGTEESDEEESQMPPEDPLPPKRVTALNKKLRVYMPQRVTPMFA